jgi:hypothetical protein
MKDLFPVLAISLFALAFSCKNSGSKSVAGDKDTIISLSNTGATVSFSKWGGALVSFQLKNDSVNPFTWSLQQDDMPANNKNGAPFRGHFLCTGRWGAPTPGEINSGIPHNGEPSNNWWYVKEKTDQSLLMECSAKLEDFEVERSVFCRPTHQLLK